MLQTSIYQPIRQSALFGHCSTDTYRFTGIPDESFLKNLNTALSNDNGQQIFSELRCNAQLELARFEGTERLEDTLCRWTQRICGQLAPLQLDINNFGGIPPNQVYARILDPGPIRKLVGDLRKLDLYLTGNGNAPLEATNRYMVSIGEKINPRDFDHILYKLGRIEFREMLKVVGLSLQRKEYKQWVNVRQFYFSA
jgi:hypothetical protein